MNLLSLYLDESGNASPKIVSPSNVYVLCGLLVSEEARYDLKIAADQIKFKYWGNTNIVFHSMEIGRKQGDFKLLRERQIRESFEKDLFHFLYKGSYEVFVILVDKEIAKVKNWDEVTVYKQTARIMVQNFVLSLLARENRGRLIIEFSTIQKDTEYLKAATTLSSRGIETVKASNYDVQKFLTEISYVTKKNHDIEEQLADLLAYGAVIKYCRPKTLVPYEIKIMKVLEAKLFKIHPMTGVHKRMYYSHIQGFRRIP